MSLPYTLISLVAATGLWWAGHGLTCTRPALQAEANPPAFALPGSAYGSLMARLIRDSLYSYWHGGESAIPSPQTSTTQNSPPPPPAGRFARKGMPPPVQLQSQTSWLENRVENLTKLEKSRTRRNSAFPLSNSHQRYLNAAADVRLRLAYQLDPGDETLYEILHFHVSSRTQPPEAAQAKVEALAQSAMAYGLRPGSSLSDSLTGAGAAINLLNEQLRPENHNRSAQAIQNQWQTLERCLARYREIRSEAQAEGWWEQMPSHRKQELEDHAKFLTRIRDMIQRTLERPATPK